MKIEITIPVLNEEDTLEEQVNIVSKFISCCLNDFDISLVIADNGSSDKTQLIAEKLEKEISHIKYLRLDERGVGRALKASWASSNADIVGYMDLDLATDLAYLKPAFNKLISCNYDLVTGSRLVEGAVVVGRKPLRKVTSLGLNFILKIFFNARFSDGMCGFKFLKRIHVEELINSGAESNGWFFATELLIVGEYKKLKIYDMPVKWTDDPNSKVKIIKLAVEYLRAMSVLKKNLKRGNN